MRQRYFNKYTIGLIRANQEHRAVIFIDGLYENYTISKSIRILERIASDLGINYIEYENKPIHLFESAIMGVL